MHIRKTICFNIKYFPPKDSRICHQAWLTTLTTFLSPSLIFYTFGGSSFLGMCWNFETQLLSDSLLFHPSLSLYSMQVAHINTCLINTLRLSIAFPLRGRGTIGLQFLVVGQSNTSFLHACVKYHCP